MSSDQNYEYRSLIASQWASLVMAIAGVVAALISRSDALMIDGLFSGLAFLSAIVAVRINKSVDRAPDRRRPFGYAANQPIFIAFRALVLLGIIIFAGFTSIQKLLIYFRGGDVQELIRGPIFVYMVAMAIISFGLAAYHKLNLRRDGTNSMMLQAEYIGAVMDGGISVAAGVALLGAPVLEGTFLEVLVPVSDQVVVLALLAFFLPQPFKIMRQAMGQVVGEAPPEAELIELRKLVEQTFSDAPVTVLEVTMQRLGRQTVVIAYVRPDKPISGETVDGLRDLLTETSHKEFGPGYGEVLIGARPAFDNE